jgi:hypothetical protein
MPGRWPCTSSAVCEAERCLHAVCCACRSGRERALLRLAESRPAPQVAAGDESAPASGDAAAAPVADLVAEFEALVAGEDPFNGEVVVRNIERPFMDASEAAEVASWQL